MRTPFVPKQEVAEHDPAVVEFSGCIAELVNVWEAMVLFSTTNAHVIATRREIARWARNTNQEFMDTFGTATASEEIRVILVGLPGCVPSKLGDTGRAFLMRTGAEARVLAGEGSDAIAAV